MKTNPSMFHWDSSFPVEGVSWHGADIFCRALTKLEQETGTLPEGWAYSLPTEEQWEYACRAGVLAPFSGTALTEVGWYFGNSWLHTHSVGLKQPNRWGFHDMHGNVSEWCLDEYGDFPNWSATVLAGAERTSLRVGRGGGWSMSGISCRSAFRDGGTAVLRSSFQGFRPVLSLASK